jgi:hypothetical protein
MDDAIDWLSYRFCGLRLFWFASFGGMLVDFNRSTVVGPISLQVIMYMFGASLSDLSIIIGV